jgi:Protein of unknown function (DUF2568)
VLVAERPWGFDSLRPHQLGWVNDGLRFLLEIALLASLAYWGFSEQTGVVHWVLGLGALVLVHLSLTFVLDQRPR